MSPKNAIIILLIIAGLAAGFIIYIYSTGPILYAPENKPAALVQKKPTKEEILKIREAMARKAMEDMNKLPNNKLPLGKKEATAKQAMEEMNKLPNNNLPPEQKEDMARKAMEDMNKLSN